MITKFNLHTVVGDNPGLLSSMNRLLEEYSDFAKSPEETIELAISTIDYLRINPVVIYGAGAAGEHFLSVLKTLNITPVYFLDRKAQIINELNGIPVYHPDKMESIIDDDYVIIVAVNGMQMAKDVIKFLRSKHLVNPILNGRYLIRILNYPVCLTMHQDRQMFDIGKCISCGADVKKCTFFTDFLKRESGFDHLNVSGSPKFDWCGIIMGQVCTLNCECCCESIPHLKNGHFVDPDEIIADIEKLSNASEYLERLEFVGGEPFLHPQLVQIIEAALQMQKVGYIYIFTNGTVIPGDDLCSLLSNPRVMVHISNYTNQWSAKDWSIKLLSKLETVKNKLAKYNVKYLLVNNTDWLDISQYEDNGLSDETLKKVFANCFINYCHRLYNGILYRCPHQYAGIQLDRLDLVPGQYVDIRSLDPIDLPQALEDFEAIEVLDSCRHCSMAVGPRQVPAGKQVVLSINGTK